LHERCNAQRNRGDNVKITFVLPDYANHPTGGFKVVYEYANHLVRNGHTATIVYLCSAKRSTSRHFPLSLFSRLERQRARLAYKRGKPKISWYSLHKDVRLVKATDLKARHVPNADAIFATAWQTASRVSECPNEKGAKFYLVMDFAPWLGDKYELEQTWRLPLKKISISSWLAELITQAGVPNEDVQAIPIAVDHDRFRVVNNVAERPKRVIMLYSPTAYKRSKLGLSTLLRCKAEVMNLEATFFGPVKERPSGLPSWIEYYGQVSESQLIILYNAASVCLCSSAAEGFALPPAEAMACGCAVVTTDCGGNRDYAEHEKTALVSDPDDFTSLVSNTLRLLSDENLRVKIALAGRERMMDFTWEKSTRQLTEFIRCNL
jgi:glycosyltransferase involved in cell wall biosynthesis